MSNYTAIGFTPVPGLVSMHGTARIGGVNQLTLSGASTLQQQQGDTYWYVVGVIAPIIAMLLIFIIWLFSLCCTRCCCKGGCGGKNTALLLFTIGCGVSFSGWILGIIASSLATNGLNSMVDGVQGATNILKDVSSTARDAGNVTSRLVQLSDAMVVQCTNNVTAFPQSSITGQLQSLSNAITGQSGTGGFAGQLDSYSSDIDKYIGMVRGYIAWQSPVTISVMSVMAAIVAIFWLSTVLRVLDKTPERCHAVATCLSKFSALLIFIFAIFFMIVLWVLIAVLHFFTTVGADLCVPSPNANLNRLIGEAVGGAINLNTGGAGRRLTDSDADADSNARAEAAVSEWARRVLDAGVDPLHPALVVAQAAHSLARGRDLAYVYNKTDPCLDPDFRSNPLGQICYYQTCTGPNYLGDLTNPIRTYTNQAVQTLTNFSDNVLTLGGNFTLTCRGSITDFNQGANNVGTFIDGALNLLSCAKLNPIWAGLLYSGFCNGLVGGLIFLYTSMIIGCSSLMLATTIYLVFDFGKYRDGRLPDSWEQDGAIIAPGSAPNLGTGAPIAREVKEGP